MDVKANWKEKQIFKNQPATFTMDITVQNLGPHALLSSSDASQPMKVMAALSINDVIDPLNDLFLDVELNEGKQDTVYKCFYFFMGGGDPILIWMHNYYYNAQIFQVIGSEMLKQNSVV